MASSTQLSSPYYYLPNTYWRRSSGSGTDSQHVAKKPACSFLSLPTEIKLEILRYAFIASPPWLDKLGRMCHPLLDYEFRHFRAEILDVFFHTVPLWIPFVSHLDNEVPEFLSFHDKIHGRHKRGLMRLKVNSRWSSWDVSTLKWVKQAWRKWGEAEGVRVDIR